mgnify:CR=1 FL=1
MGSVILLALLAHLAFSLLGIKIANDPIYLIYSWSGLIATCYMGFEKVITPFLLKTPIKKSIEELLSGLPPIRVTHCVLHAAVSLGSLLVFIVFVAKNGKSALKSPHELGEVVRFIVMFATGIFVIGYKPVFESLPLLPKRKDEPTESITETATQQKVEKERVKPKTAKTMIRFSSILLWCVTWFVIAVFYEMLRPEIRRFIISIVSSIGIQSINTISQITGIIMAVLFLALLYLLFKGIIFIWKKSAISAD